MNHIPENVPVFRLDMVIEQFKLEILAYHSRNMFRDLYFGHPRNFRDHPVFLLKPVEEGGKCELQVFPVLGRKMLRERFKEILCAFDFPDIIKSLFQAIGSKIYLIITAK